MEKQGALKENGELKNGELKERVGQAEMNEDTQELVCDDAMMRTCISPDQTFYRIKEIANISQGIKQLKHHKPSDYKKTVSLCSRSF